MRFLLLLWVGASLAGCGEPCDDRAGYVTCGYCSDDRVATGNPHGGTCRYCKAGLICSGDVCSDALSCTPAASGTHNSQSQQGVCSGATVPCGTSYCAPSGATCCAPVGHPELSCAAGHTCTSAGTCTAPTGNGGGMGECGTCSGSLECSGWYSGTRCSWQSCACYYMLNGSDVWKEFYHSSDGACFQCDTNGTTCTSAAQSLVNHCY